MRKKKSPIKNLNKIVKKSVSNFKPPELITVSEWADKYRRLSVENSAEPGRWKTSRTPYLQEIMDSFTDPKIHRIVVVASSQVGKTEMEMNMLGYAIDIDPGPIMFVLPTVDNAKDFSPRRLAPMIRDTKPLRSKVASSKSRDQKNTILKKTYPGGMLTLTGSNSAASLASVPARYVFGDERDRWAKDADGEGDPWGLVEARTTTFYNHKMIEVSTPTIKGDSAIADSFETGTREYWSAQCPHCNEYNYVTFNDIKFEYDSSKVNGKKQYIVKSAEYVCPKCGCISSEFDIKKAPHKWIAKSPEAYQNGIRSFWINGFSSPWMGWKKIVLRFLQAKDDPLRLKTVYNTLFGELWEDRGELADEEEMLQRREEYEAELPDGVLVLTMGVDTQDDRLEYEVVGHGRYGETWGIEKGFIMGKPSLGSSVWEKLLEKVERQWEYKDGRRLKVSITFIDSGGHYTQEVYEFCRLNIRKKIFAIKGKGGESVPYTTVPSKAKIVIQGHKPAKCWLYIIGVDAGKERIMSNLKVQEPGSNYMHFPKGEIRQYDLAFFNGLISEKLVLTQTKRGKKWEWVKLPGHRRNEALDCRNYAMAAFNVLNPDMQRLYEEFHNISVDKENTNRPKPKPKKQQRRKQTYEDW